MANITTKASEFYQGDFTLKLNNSEQQRVNKLGWVIGDDPTDIKNGIGTEVEADGTGLGDHTKLYEEEELEGTVYSVAWMEIGNTRYYADEYCEHNLDSESRFGFVKSYE